MNLWNIYHNEIPDFVRRIAETAPMRRLKQVGMNCGCEYTSFPTFDLAEPYSRYEHSVGAGLIVWHFTRNVQQSVAALLHDIATPAFAHVVDFLHNDHERQESTEDLTLTTIQSCPELVALLSELSLSPDDVADYHLFPIADNDTPHLSSDRLEYTMGNIVNFGLAPRKRVGELYQNLCVSTNEEGVPEIMFEDAAVASEFARLSLRCSKLYVSDEDRYAMQRLALLLKEAIGRGVITEADLMLTEPQIIAKLTADKEIAEQWTHFRSLSQIFVGESGTDALMVPAKKRCINPYVPGRGRVAEYDEEYRVALKEFQNYSFEYWIAGR